LPSTWKIPGSRANPAADYGLNEFHYASLTSAGDDEPFAQIADGAGKASVETGGRRGRVTGTFFHAIAAAS
jgi:cobyrinic acid a,c-diamide synthase